MSREHELPSDSEDDDEDYVPGGADSEAGSEAESEGEVESGGAEDDNEENGKDSLKKGKGKFGKGKKRSGKQKTGSRKKKLRIVSEEEGNGENGETEGEGEKKKLSEEEEKKRADSLWADFMKDTPVASKPKSTNLTNSSRETISSIVSRPANVEKIKITKVFEFAGEEVRVEKEVPADCAEARLSSPLSVDATSDSTQSRGAGARGRGIRKGGGGLSGISSVLGQLGKKAKISTLEKSKLDWDSYKKEKNIEEEISTHNKGKDGYLEKQDFLQRADLRQFEIEKQMRSSRRSTR